MFGPVHEALNGIGRHRVETQGFDVPIRPVTGLA